MFLRTTPLGIVPAIFIDVLIPCFHQVGDLLNLVSAFSFAIHMLRTEHISRNIKKQNFLTLVGCEVSILTKTHYLSYVSSFLFLLTRFLNKCKTRCLL